MNTRETCLPWLATTALPAWSQQQVVLSDGVSPDQRWNECGETCVSMLAAAVWGARLSPDALRAATNGVAGSGLTNGTDIANQASYANVVMRSHDTDAAGAQALATAAVADGRPVAILGEWPTPGGVLHWLLVTATTPGGVSYINPWGGVHSSITWQVFADAYRGTVVECRAHLHVDASGWGLPW